MSFQKTKSIGFSLLLGSTLTLSAQQTAEVRGTLTAETKAEKLAVFQLAPPTATIGGITIIEPSNVTNTHSPSSERAGACASDQRTLQILADLQTILGALVRLSASASPGPAPLSTPIRDAN